MQRPLVSVVMSVYNGEKYLKESIESMLSQTFSDFEFIIINDGSTDGTSGILRRFSNKDRRIKVISNSGNLGLTRSLNLGIGSAKGSFIARMDADDVSALDRLRKQVDFMQKTPSVALCGTLGHYINEKGEVIGKKNLPTDYKKIKKKLLFNNKFIHSSIMIRSDVLEKLGAYNESFKTSQDYELVLRIAAKNKVVNLPERLINWRIDPTSLSWSSKEQEFDALRARVIAIAQYGYPKLKGVFCILIRLFYILIPQSLKILRHRVSRR